MKDVVLRKTLRLPLFLISPWIGENFFLDGFWSEDQPLEIIAVGGKSSQEALVRATVNSVLRDWGQCECGGEERTVSARQLVPLCFENS